MDKLIAISAIKIDIKAMLRPSMIVSWALLTKIILKSSIKSEETVNSVMKT